MGHPVLRARARPLSRSEINSAPFQQLIDDLIETMHEYRGVGLAAPQVHESVRLFVAGLTEVPDESEAAAEDPTVLINPEITPTTSEMFEEWEGCLSIPDVRGRVPRSREIRVRALDRRGERVELRARDFSARVIQHETDHLDGILFLDRMKSLESLTFLEEFSRYWAKD